MSKSKLKAVNSKPDIKPYDLEALAANMLEQEEIIAGVYILMDKNDDLVWNSAAMTKKDMLWAIEHMKKDLMEGL